MPEKHSPIVHAIAEAETRMTGEIHVHLSKRRFERDPLTHAMRLFARFGMERTSHRNGVLLYVNLRKRKMAILGDTAVHQAVGQTYWESVMRELGENLRATHSEHAIALAVRRIGDTLEKFFPPETGPKTDELSNEVTED